MTTQRVSTTPVYRERAARALSTDTRRRVSSVVALTLALSGLSHYAGLVNDQFKTAPESPAHAHTQTESAAAPDGDCALL